MQRQYMFINEAAEILGVTPLTLRNWDNQGKLVAYRHPINNRRVYRLDELQSFLRSIESFQVKKNRPNRTRKQHIKADEG